MADYYMPRETTNDELAEMIKPDHSKTDLRKEGTDCVGNRGERTQKSSETDYDT